MNMQISIFMSSLKKNYCVEGVYTFDKVIVKRGGKISSSFSDAIRGGNAAKKVRQDKMFVSDDYVLLQDCYFDSLSTAAQFVSGSSLDGYICWKIDTKKHSKSIGTYLEENGLRNNNKRNL